MNLEAIHSHEPFPAIVDALNKAFYGWFIFVGSLKGKPASYHGANIVV
jgi:hypothetical protein